MGWTRTLEKPLRPDKDLCSCRCCGHARGPPLGPDLVACGRDHALSGLLAVA